MEDTSEEHADQRAHFEALVRPHMQGLFTLAWRLSRDTALAEDLVQETMLKAYRFLHRFEPGTNFRAWLITMMRNLYFSQVRKRGREIVTDHVERIAPFAAYPVVEEPDVSQLTELTAALPHLMSDDVFNALQDLPETYRTAVLLADVLEYSYKDMALTMGCRRNIRMTGHQSRKRSPILYPAISPTKNRTPTVINKMPAKYSLPL